MVRTLVFQSSNVGSIPAGPILNSSFQKKFQLNQLHNNHLLSSTNIINYNFQFISLIAPFLVNNLRMSTIGSNNTTNAKVKILLKQSYLILTWFYYLTFSQNMNSTLSNTNTLSFSFLPCKSKSYTLTKAPMAQKTRSKEQFHFKFYILKVSMRTYLINSYKFSSIDQTLLTLLTIKKTFPIFETNMLFLKHYNLSLHYSDAVYFNYYRFLLKSSEKNVSK